MAAEIIDNAINEAAQTLWEWIWSDGMESTRIILMWAFIGSITGWIFKVNYIKIRLLLNSIGGISKSERRKVKRAAENEAEAVSLLCRIFSFKRG
jgi:hypothetical protein